MKQYEAVIETLDKLGGVATLGELNREVFKISDCEWKTKTPFASIRRIVQQTKGIYKIKPGLYGLEKYRKQIEDRGIIVETEKNKDSNDVIMFNHTYYQGILLIIGKFRNMQTFVPKQDKNKKFYDGHKLHELSTLAEQPPYSYPQLIKRSATIAKLTKLSPLKVEFAVPNSTRPRVLLFRRLISSLGKKLSILPRLINRRLKPGVALRALLPRSPLLALRSLPVAISISSRSR